MKFINLRSTLLALFFGMMTLSIASGKDLSPRPEPKAKILVVPKSAKTMIEAILSPDGKTFISRSKKHKSTLSIWDFNTLQLVNEIRLDSEIDYDWYLQYIDNQTISFSQSAQSSSLECDTDRQYLYDLRSQTKIYDGCLFIGKVLTGAIDAKFPNTIISMGRNVVRYHDPKTYKALKDIEVYDPYDGSQPFSQNLNGIAGSTPNGRPTFHRQVGYHSDSDMHIDTIDISGASLSRSPPIPMADDEHFYWLHHFPEFQSTLLYLEKKSDGQKFWRLMSYKDGKIIKEYGDYSTLKHTKGGRFLLHFIPNKGITVFDQKLGEHFEVILPKTSRGDPVIAGNNILFFNENSKGEGNSKERISSLAVFALEARQLRTKETDEAVVGVDVENVGQLRLQSSSRFRFDISDAGLEFLGSKLSPSNPHLSRVEIQKHFNSIKYFDSALIISPDGSLSLSMELDGALSFYNSKTGTFVKVEESLWRKFWPETIRKQVRRMRENGGQVKALDKWGPIFSSPLSDRVGAFSNSGEKFIWFSKVGSDPPSIHAIDTRDGSLISRAETEPLSCNALVVINEDSIACHTRINSITTVYLIDVKTGQVKKRLPTPSLLTSKLALDDSGRFLLSWSNDGVHDLYDTNTAKKIAHLFTSINNSWFIITEHGFYAENSNFSLNARVSFGLESFKIDRFRDTLNRPDLIYELISGDPESLYLQAASSTSLDKILSSGTAPIVEIKGEIIKDVFVARSIVKETGGGVGILEWRVNGVVRKLGTRADASSAELFLAPGNNTIELVAYNRENNIRSDAANMRADLDHTIDIEKRLFILAIAADDYENDNLDLRFTKSDARSFIKTVQTASKGIYSEIRTITLFDGQANRNEIDKKMRELASQIRPTDVFILFVAGHGKTSNGRYFFIPPNFEIGSPDKIELFDEQLTKFGIGHSAFSEWFSAISAQQSLILFDTCESGSITETLVGKDLRYQAAGKQLASSTGRAIMVASSSVGVALEGYRDHGLFTYSLLDAISQGDKNQNGLISVQELSQHLSENLPRLAEQNFSIDQIPHFKPPNGEFTLWKSIDTADHL